MGTNPLGLRRDGYVELSTEFLLGGETLPLSCLVEPSPLF